MVTNLSGSKWNDNVDQVQYNSLFIGKLVMDNKWKKEEGEFNPSDYLAPQDQSFSLQQLKADHRKTSETVKKSKQLTARLNRFLQSKNNSTSNTYSIESDEMIRTSFEAAQSTHSGGGTKASQQKGKNIRPSMILLQSTGSSASQEEPITNEQNQKRNIVYQHDTYKQQFDNLDQSTIESNNKLFEMVFLKKGALTDSVSTNSSLKKMFVRKEDSSLSIKDFVLGKKLGAGKSGEVFAAKDRKSGFLVALKKIRKDFVDPKTLTQLIREIKIQGYLDHPNVVKLYNFFSDESYIYLALEYCASGDLYSLIKKSRRMEEHTVQNIIRQVCKAIQYMHQNTILHRDIKPENILFHNGMIKICDFGWSISSTVSRQTFCGTPLYVSPQLLKRNNYSNKIDVWSIGILTHQLLFGRVPFDIFTEGDLIKIVQDDIRFSKHVPIGNETKSFIMSCLQKDPRDRLSVTQLLEHPFLTLDFGKE